MGRGGEKPFYSGPVVTPSVDDLDAFIRQAAKGDRFVYCEAPELIRNETSARVGELAADRIVSPLRERRQGGGWRFFIERTGYRSETKPTPQEEALADAATDLIFRELKRAANFAMRCPSDEHLRRKAGLMTRAQAQQRFRKLIAAALIESTLAFENGVPFRVVAIPSTGKTTALPGKWQALQDAARAESGGRNG